MANDGQDIDLYADDLEFNQVGDLAHSLSDGSLRGDLQLSTGHHFAPETDAVRQADHIFLSIAHSNANHVSPLFTPGHPLRVQDATEFNDQNVDLYDDVITQSGKNTSSANNNSHHDDEYGANNREHSSSASNSNEFHSSHHHQHHQHHSTNEIQSNPSSNSSSTKKIGIYVGNLTWVCIST